MLSTPQEQFKTYSCEHAVCTQTEYQQKSLVTSNIYFQTLQQQLYL